MSIQSRLISVGAGSVLLLASTLVYKFEGEVLSTYQDPVGIWTVCIGHTSPNLKPGQIFTLDQCTELLLHDLTKAQQGVHECIPQVTMLRPEVEAALVSFTLNVGKGALCKSTLARKLRTGDVLGACNELPRWVYAKGIKLPGLINRRQAERVMCLRGVNAT